MTWIRVMSFSLFELDEEMSGISAFLIMLPLPFPSSICFLSCCHVGYLERLDAFVFGFSVLIAVSAIAWVGESTTIAYRKICT